MSRNVGSHALPCNCFLNLCNVERNLYSSCNIIKCPYLYYAIELKLKHELLQYVNDM